MWIARTSITERHKMNPYEDPRVNPLLINPLLKDDLNDTFEELEPWKTAIATGNTTAGISGQPVKTHLEGLLS